MLDDAEIGGHQKAKSCQCRLLYSVCRAWPQDIEIETSETDEEVADTEDDGCDSDQEKTSCNSALLLCPFNIFASKRPLCSEVLPADGSGLLCQVPPDCKTEPSGD